MSRFNLTFRGEILPDYDPEQVRTRLAEFLEIDDPVQLAQCFSGETIILRRDLDRKNASLMYAGLSQLGARVQLVTILERSRRREPESAGSAARPAPTAVTPNRSPPVAPVTTAEQAQPQHTAPGGRTAPNRPGQAEQQHLTRVDSSVLKAKEKALKNALRAKKQEQSQQASLAAKAEKKAARAQAQQARQQQRAREVQAAAELAQRNREEAQQRARAAAELAAEKQRAATARAAELAQAKIRIEQLAVEARAETARHKQKLAADAAERKIRERRQQAQEQARQQQLLAEQVAQRTAMEEQAITRAAAELAQNPSLKTTKAQVKTRLELPQRNRSRDDTSGDQTKRKRQPGEPNLYSLSPFRNTPAIQARAGQSRRRMKLAFVIAGVALVVALIAIVGLLSLPVAHGMAASSAMALDPQGRPLLLAGNQLLLHDRSGAATEALSLEALRVAELKPPLAFNPAGQLLAMGRLSDQNGDLTTPTLQLLRCDLAASHCEEFSAELATSAVSALVVNPLDGVLFVADAAASQLLKVSPEGQVLARAQVNIPRHPVLRLDSGLLLMNSAQAPGISVFRYEDSAFGQQLDEILPVVPSAPAGANTRIWDFSPAADGWWVALYTPRADSPGNASAPGSSNNPDDSHAELIRFDNNWQFLSRVLLDNDSWPEQLLRWGPKTLVRDSRQTPIQRFNDRGEAEAPWLSKSLDSLVSGQQQLASLTVLGWRIGLVLAALAAVAGWGGGFIHRARSMVYKTCRGHGAEPIDERSASIEWVDPAVDRAARLRNTSISWAVVAAGLLLLALGLGVSVVQLSSLLLALAGPVVALTYLYRGSPGHIGIVDQQLLLVDHNGMYHLGGGSRIHYRGHFLMIDDVTVFTGTRLLPVFAGGQLQQAVTPLITSGVKVDRRIVLVKLLQGRHPLALGAIAILVFLGAAIAVLSLQGIG